MRIDLFLKLSRLIKQREAAKKACDRGMVFVNGRPAKPGREVQAGDRLAVEWPHRRLEAEVVEIPAGNVSKPRSQTLYRILNSEALTGDADEADTVPPP
jgi:ribosomal 50S subunit-recycling heat shock protein